VSLAKGTIGSTQEPAKTHYRCHDDAAAGTDPISGTANESRS
jgi:hypothetical protein